MRCCSIALLLLLAWNVCLPARAADESRGYSYELFNGKNLDGWHVTGCEVEIDGGALRLESGDGFVRTDHRYGDFVLDLEWRALTKEKYDSGIYIRCELPQGERPWPRQYQVNLLEGKEGVINGLEGSQPRTDLIKPGDWNRFRITAIGETVSLEINGQAAWKGSGLKAPSGFIGFQSEVPGGGRFEFRNIRVTELTHRSMFNGKDLQGWQPGNGKEATCWMVEDGLLVCNGKKGPWLRSEEQYGDFNLRLDYMLKPGGNSGVYVRVPLNGDHRGQEANQQEAGTEIQLLDDRAERYAKLKPYQYTGSVYAIAPAKEHVGRDPGQWNSIEIDCRGTRYRITHNGVVIVDADTDEFPELKNRLLQGYLGLQNHSEEVWFRNLRVGPPLD